MDREKGREFNEVRRSKDTHSVVLHDFDHIRDVRRTNGNANSCSQASGAGRWAFTAVGSVILPTGISVPITQVGSFKEDKEGNVSGSQTRSIGGAVGNETFAGTASVNPDCTGTATLAVYDETSGALVRTTSVFFILDDDGNHARSIVASIVLADGTRLAPLLTLDYRRIFSQRSN